MAKVVYVLCFLLSASCAGLLFRKYFTSKSKLLFWTGISFLMLSLNNLILFVDLVIFPDIDFGGDLLRVLTGAIGGSILLFGLIWETR